MRQFASGFHRYFLTAKTWQDSKTLGLLQDLECSFLSDTRFYLFISSQTLSYPLNFFFFHIQVSSFFIPSVFQKVLVPTQLSLTPPLGLLYNSIFLTFSVIQKSEDGLKARISEENKATAPNKWDCSVESVPQMQRNWQLKLSGLLRGVKHVQPWRHSSQLETGWRCCMHSTGQTSWTFQCPDTLTWTNLSHSTPGRFLKQNY